MENITVLKPLDIKPEQRVRVHYNSSTVREGIAKQHDYYGMVVKQEDESIAALFHHPNYSPTEGWGPYIERVELLEDAPADPRIVELEAEIERLNAVIRQRNADVSSAITREGEAREREQDITEALDDLKRKVGAEWVRLAEVHDWDMDTVERAIDHLDLELPKPKPLTFSVTLDLEFTATPANRKVAERLGEHATIEQVRLLVEEALTDLDQIDLDPDLLELDIWNSMKTEVRDADVN